ncbi:hypothetical protein JADG_008770 [Aureobasidium aubasidani]|nr:hypothetical protein JADG_008770 [Aureobasidium pullulans]
MHFSTVSAVVIATLCATSQAWEVIAYDNVWSCKADKNTKYRSITGANTLTGCQTFGKSMPNTGCREYRNGGSSNGNCGPEALIPWSVYMKGGNCVVWDQAGCQGRYADSNGPVNGCSDFKSYGWEEIGCPDRDVVLVTSKNG